MDEPKSNMDFKLMTLTYKFRDFLWPRMDILQEVGIMPGFRVLDYGCGPGSYILSLSKLVGPSGQIYALDIHPLAVKKVKSLVLKKGLKNVETIQSDCATGLPDESLDAVLLYDILHDLDQPEAVLNELHRILKNSGILSFSDHHMKEPALLSCLTDKGLFALSKKGETTYNFQKSIP
ncbi:MAG: class I SAM-dependent methyltransferase [Pseudomonadota bacterium]